jgi:hypothetical protein
MWSILVSVSYLSLKSNGPFKLTVPLMAAMIFLLYLVGELNGKHSVEILFYWFAILSALQLISVQPKIVVVEGNTKVFNAKLG